MPACPKPTPRVLLKEQSARTKAAHQRAVYAAVRRREGGRCRICGTRRGTLQHHHVVGGSGRRKDETGNVVLICARCHAYRHAGLITIKGNADGALAVAWNLPQPRPVIEEVR